MFELLFMVCLFQNHWRRKKKKKLIIFLNFLFELLLLGKLWQANARKQALIDQLQRHDAAIADQKKEG